MILSARARTAGESVRPRVFAVFRFTISSNFVACSTGRSPGLAPLTARGAWAAAGPEDEQKDGRGNPAHDHPHGLPMVCPAPDAQVTSSSLLRISPLVGLRDHISREREEEFPFD